MKRCNLSSILNKPPITPIWQMRHHNQYFFLQIILIHHFEFVSNFHFADWRTYAKQTTSFVNAFVGDTPFSHPELQ